MLKIPNGHVGYDPGDIALGDVRIPNVGDGDTKLSFDKSNPIERARAAKIVNDMLRNGYAILIQVGVKDDKPLFQRATAFDPDTCEYIIANAKEKDFTINIGQEANGEKNGTITVDQQPTQGETQAAKAPTVSEPKGKGGRKSGKGAKDRKGKGVTRVPAEKTRATAVARTSGG